MQNYYGSGGLASGVVPGVAAPTSRRVVRVDSTSLANVESGPLWTMYSIAHLVSMGVLGYHGYKRNDSVGWAIVWGLFGSIVWPITVPIAIFAQGYGKPRLRKNRLRRKRRRSRR